MPSLRPKSALRLLLSAFLVLAPVLLVTSPAGSSAQADAAREWTRALITDLEKGKYEADPAAVSPLLDAEAEKLLVHLEDHPGDIDAVLALMDLYELSQLFMTIEMPSPSELPDSLGPMGPYIVMRDRITSPYHRVLDRALSQAPDNPALHAWKGRLHSLYEPLIAGSGIDSLHSRLPEAIAEVRRAVELAPGEAGYREWLAILLLIWEQEEEATAEFGRLAGGKHPMYVLLRDWEALPEPDGLTRDRGTERSMAEMSGASGLDYAHARFRAYEFPGTAEELSGLYRNHWPGFQLWEDTSPDEGGDRRSFCQYFRVKSRALHPAAKSRKDVPQSPDQGISMMVFETRNVPGPHSGRRAAAAGAQVSCSILFENHREVD